VHPSSAVFLTCGVAVFAALTLAACNVITASQDDAHSSDAFEKIRSIDLLPQYPRQAENPNSGPSQTPRAAVYAGSETATVAGVQPSGGGEGYELNFENAPVTTVAKVILGDILGTSYTIDPRVQGTVSLASGRPVPKSQILFVLESALRVSNVVLVRDTVGYRITPAGEAIGAGNMDQVAARAEPGYGISVIPLQHMSAQTLIKLLDSFAVKPGTVRADPGHNMLIVQGNGNERRSTIDTALSFDNDWMRGQSVAIYPVHNSTPEPLIAELEKIMDTGEGGLGQSMVMLQPISRLNAIMVVTRKPELLKTAATWISRLDSSDTATTGVKVYRVRYGEARQIARLLNDIFVGSGGGSSGLDTAANQIAPGAGVTTQTSSGSALVVGQPSQGTSGVRQPLSTITGGATGAGGSDTGQGSNTLGGLSRGGSGGGGSSSGGGGPILPGVRITADVINNTLLIYANQESYRVIERTLRQLDRPQLQVAIDATIAEVTLNNNLNYGVQFFLKSSDLGLGTDKGSIINSIGGAVLGQTLPGFNLLVGSQSEPRLIIDALHRVADVKVLSNPSLVVLDNQAATLQVGDQVPIATGSATVLTTNTPIVNTIDYRNTGIILRVVPRINFNGTVVLDIEQEISNVASGSANTLTPTVSQRKVKSSIAVASGQTVLLAGLISERGDNSRSGIPFLDQLPGIGDAFSHNNKSNERTELIIFIRPQIIRDSVDASMVAEELRSKLRGKVGSAEQLLPGPKVLPIAR
jgi:general secretion pathway protein D